MSSLFDIGKSAIQSYRQALAVTGQNIANVNTDGYKRREADLKEVSASTGSVTSTSSQAGLGVRVEDIRRSFDQFLLDRSRSSIANHQKLEAYLDQLKSLENTLLPGDADLGSYIGRFFGSLQEVTANPGDLAPRTVALEEGKNLAGAFRNISTQLKNMQNNGLSRAQDTTTAINIIVEQLVDVNNRLLSSSSGSSPNSTLDLRDRLLEDLSKLTDISVSYKTRKDVVVTVGNTGAGPKLLDGKIGTKIGTIESGSVLQTIMAPGTSSTPTNQVTGGILAGVIDSYSLVGDVIRDIDGLALTISQTVNDVHKNGLTLDGKQGENMFVTSGLSVVAGTANRSTVSGEISLNNVEELPQGILSARFSKNDNRWEVTGNSIDKSYFGTSTIKLPGFSVNIIGSPTDGDELQFQPLSGAASGMQFNLRRAQDFAAAAKTLVSANTSNKGNADITANVKSITVNENPPKIDDIFTNSNSPLTATSFLSDGSIAAIPAGSEAVELLSFKNQAQASFQLTTSELKAASSLTLEINGATHTFDLSYSTSHPNAAATDNWTDSNEIALMLNRGIIKNNASPNPQRLSDIGLYAAGSGGTFTLASSTGDFTGQADLTAGGSTIIANKTLSSSGSDIQVFTREGRHLAGSPLSKESIARLVTNDNGFSNGATYRADYLNLSGTNAYRGLSIARSNPTGQQIISFGNNSNSVTSNTSGVSSSIGSTITSTSNHGFSSGDIVQYNAASTALTGLSDKALYKVSTVGSTTQFTLTSQNGTSITYGGSGGNSSDTFKLYNINTASALPSVTTYPDSPIKAYTSTISIIGGESGSVSVPAGSSAAYTSNLINTNLANLGIQAKSKTRVEIKMSDIDVSSTSNTTGISSASSATITSTSTHKFKVGDTVQYNAAGTVLTGLEHLKNYTVSSVDSTSTFTLKDTDGSSLTYGGGGGNASDTFKIIRRSGEFAFNFESKNQEAISISSTIASDDMTDLARQINVHSLNTGVNAYLSTDKKRIVLENDLGNDIMISNQSSGSIPVIATVLDRNNQTLGSSIELDYSNYGAARFTGYIDLVSSGTFTVSNTVGSNTTTLSSSTDVFSDGFVKKELLSTGEQMSIEFSAFEGADGNGSAVDGSKALASGASYSLTIPSTGSGTAFTGSVSSSSLENISKNAIAKEIAKSLRSSSPIVSATGGKSVDQIPSAGQNLTLSYSGQNYKLTMLDNGREAIPSTSTLTVSNSTSIGSIGNAINLTLSAAGEDDVALNHTLASGQLALSHSATALTSISDLYSVNHAGNSLIITRSDGKNFTLKTGGSHNVSMSFEGSSISANSTITDTSDGRPAQEREIQISGGETGRIDAYFDQSKTLRIFGGSTISGQSITIPDDNTVSGNSSAAALFGFTNATRKLSGSEIAVPSSNSNFDVSLNGENYTLTVNPTSSNQVSLSLQDRNGNTPTLARDGIGVEWSSNIHTSNTTSVISGSGAQIITNASNSLQVGQTVKYIAAGTAVNSLTHLQSYKISSVTKETNSLSNTSSISSAAGATITSTSSHSFKVGDLVEYVAGGTALTGLTSGNTYKIGSVTGDNQFSLKNTDGSSVTYGGNGSSTDAFIRKPSLSLEGTNGSTISYGGGNGHANDAIIDLNQIKTSNTSSVSSSLGAQLSTNTAHGFNVGDTVRYFSNGGNGNGLTGLSHMENYKVASVPSSTAFTLTNDAGTAITYGGSGGNASDVFVKSNGRLVINTNINDSKEIIFPSSSSAEALGIKVSDYKVDVDGDKLKITSTDGDIVKTSSAAVTSLVNSQIKINDVPNEDLIVIVNGGGARNISARFDPPPSNYTLEATNIDIKVSNSEGTAIEFLDSITGHSLATRTLDSLGQTEAVGYNVTVKGKGQLNDTFKISSNKGGTGDARNLEEIIKLQHSDVSGANSGGFREVFDNIVTGVGASVQAGDLSLEAAQATRDAAVASELEFSGVSLDTEAAHLLEQQQAFQASARIIATAKQLFNTLLEVV